MALRWHNRRVISQEISVQTGGEAGVFDITADVAHFCDGHGDGLVSVFIPHATAGVGIFETGAGSDSDVLETVDRLLPRESNLWRHEHGTPGHGRDHVLPAFVSPSTTVPVIDGRLAIGTWQSICLIDTNVDNPTRTVRLSFLPG